MVGGGEGEVCKGEAVSPWIFPFYACTDAAWHHSLHFLVSLLQRNGVHLFLRYRIEIRNDPHQSELLDTDPDPDPDLDAIITLLY
jgi:hypothetical protein